MAARLPPIPIFDNPAIPYLLFVLACVTGYFTYDGASTAIAAGAITWMNSMGAVLYAIGSSTCLFAIWKGLPIMVAKAETWPERIAVLSLIIPANVMILGLSSWLNIVSIAGDSAVNSHMNAQITPFEKALAHRQHTLTKLNGFKVDFSNNSKTFFARQRSEFERGAYTGIAGPGTVEQTLGTMAEQFTTQSETLSQSVAPLLQQAASLKHLLANLRKAANAPGDPNTRIAAYGRHADALRNGLIAIDPTPTIDSLKRSLSGLTSEASISAVSAKTEAGATKQRAALARVADETRVAVDVLITDLDALLVNDIEVPGFTRIDPIEAVMRYPLQHAPFWVGGIAMDVTPSLLLLCSMLILAIRGRQGVFTDRVSNLTVGEIMTAMYGREFVRSGLMDLDITTRIHDSLVGTLPEQPLLPQARSEDNDHDGKPEGSK